MPRPGRTVTTNRGLAPGFSPAGDLGGSLRLQVVNRVRGTLVKTAGGALASDLVLTTTGPGTADWLPGGGGSSGTATGDLGGTYPDPIVKQLSGQGGVLTVLANDVVSQSVLNGRTGTKEHTLKTTDSADHALATYSVPSGSSIIVDIEVLVIRGDATYSRWFKRSRSYLLQGSPLTLYSGALRLVDDEQIGVLPPTPWTLQVEELGAGADPATVRVLVNSQGVVATWYMLSQRITLTPAA